MSKVIALTALSLLVVPAAFAAGKPCEELKAEIAAKLDAKGVKGYTLEAVANDAVGDAKVIGSCGTECLSSEERQQLLKSGAVYR